MFNYKFKIGDKVEVIRNSPLRGMSYHHKIPIGTMVTITERYHNDNFNGQYDEFNYYKTSFDSYYNNVVEKDLQKQGVKPKNSWVELKIAMTDFYSIPENEADEVIELLKLKEAIRELTPKDLSLKDQ